MLTQGLPPVKKRSLCPLYKFVIQPQDESTELFEPELLVKEYFKKVKGKGKKEQETKIENNLKGLYDYLTAPNIKKKLKNLLFFILRFFNCIKVYLPVDDSKGVSVALNY